MLFTAFDVDFSGKGLILILGGVFLLYKSTKEIFHVQSFMAVGERQQIVGYIKYLWRFGVSAKPFSFRGKKGDRAAELFSSVIYVRL